MSEHAAGAPADPWIGPRGSATTRLLGALRARGPMTRADAARLTGMSVSGVRRLVAELVADGHLVERAGQPGGGRGRPGGVLVPVVPDGLVLGLDFGHTHVAVMLADTRGRQRHYERVDADVDTHAADVLDVAAQIAGRAQQRVAAGARFVHAVAGVPAPVGRDGRVRSPTIASSWWQLPVAAEIGRRLDLPAERVDVVNDAQLGAVGEHRAGAARGCDDMLYVKASHGLGTGLILRGALYSGAHGLSGEIGHAVVRDDGELCRCGSRGCLETVVAVERVRRQVGFVMQRDDDNILGLAAEHPGARRVVGEAGRALGRALADACNLLDPQRIVLGGELAEAGEPLEQGVAESIRRYAQPAVGEPEIRLATLGEKAQVVGAAVLATERARADLWLTPNR
ncbi:ROK family transcriptional regulator [uncultured Jatrophihabitans sp.]|uniref:ROK family transcriptional regulator n=1 Tax=uncultured Jatrophihabitans sp. TaxID=1610747 RepID=UPI0035CB2398